MEKRFNLFLYDGRGGGNDYDYDHLEDVLDFLRSLIKEDEEMISQFEVEDNGFDITYGVAMFLNNLD